ncbi:MULTISPECIES: GntR family transcriptional regulator [Cupriavidus]|uniref:GntR family transcriptional regulator n=1 Tax=Cupriavidus alkaliphilus TaxID=942866 RepID=A0A7W4YTB7_9BURK|nr:MULTISPECIES: GntR family transcriptional regulator [Cupriavidus]MBB3009959.1 GntR family transcriptional regulator [Cupriavidus alkaliphilus]
MTSSSISLKAQGTLLHRQLYLTLKQQITTGHFREGDRLPTQEALSAQFSVSRITVRRALAELQADGLVQNEQGVGAFVRAQVRRTPTSVSLTYLEGLALAVSETQVTVLKVEMARPPLVVASMLQLDDNDFALHVVRIRAREGTPLMHLDAWMPPRFQPRVSAAELERRPLYQLQIRDDIELGEVIQEVTAEMADPPVAGHLKVEVNSPILRMTRLVHDSRQRPIQYLLIRSSPQRTRMVMSIPGSQLNTIGAGHLVHDVG